MKSTTLKFRSPVRLLRTDVLQLELVIYELTINHMLLAHKPVQLVDLEFPVRGYKCGVQVFA